MFFPIGVAWLMSWCFSFFDFLILGFLQGKGKLGSAREAAVGRRKRGVAEVVSSLIYQFHVIVLHFMVICLLYS